MRIFGRALLVAVASIGMESMASAQWWNEIQHMTIHFGGRFLEDETFWEPTDQPFVTGFEYDQRALDTGFGWEAATFFAFDSEDDIDGAGLDVDLFLFEGNLGMRYTLDAGRFHPYIGGGGAIVYADITAEMGGLEASEDDVAFGGYVHTGAYWRIGESFTLGIDARALLGTSVDFDTSLEGDVDYFQITAAIGWIN